MKLPQSHIMRADDTACCADCATPCARRDALEEEPCVYPVADLSADCPDYLSPESVCPDCDGTGNGEPHYCGSACRHYGCEVGGSHHECPACDGTGVIE